MRSSALLLLLLAGAGGCLPLPIPHTYEVAPAVQGRLVREDGTPVVGRQLATGRSYRGTRCDARGPMATTDSAGGFALPVFERRSKVTWITMMESFGLSWYALCTGAPEDTFAHQVTTVIGVQGTDEIDCLEWTFSDHSRITCGSLAGPRVITGGAWHSGPTGGTFRLILSDDPNGWWLSMGYLQWIAHDPVTGLDRVAGITWVPAQRRERFEGIPEFHERAGRWFLEGPGPQKGWPLVHTPTVRFELGGPGELWRSSDRS